MKHLFNFSVTHLTISFLIILTLSVPCDILQNLGISSTLEAAEPAYTHWQLPEGAIARLGKGRINDITFSPNGTLLAVATSIGTWIYKTDSGKELSLLTGHEVEVISAAFSPDGHTLISADSNGESRRWNVATGEQLSILTEGSDIVRKVDISADGTTLVTYHMDRRFRLWDLSNPKSDPLVIDDTKRSVNILDFSADGKIIAVTKTPFHSDSKPVENYRLQVWDTNTQNLLINVHGEDPYIRALEFSPDGDTLVTADSNEEIQFWNVKTGSTTLAFKSNKEGTISLAIAPNSKLLATGDSDSNIRLWEISSDMQKSSLRKILDGHRYSVNVLEFSPDGKTLLSASRDGIILAWDVKTGNQRFKITGHVGLTQQLAYSDTHNILISANSHNSTWIGWDTHIHHWDMNSGSPLSTDPLEFIVTKEISPDCKTVVIKKENGKIDFLDIHTKKPSFSITDYKKNELNDIFAFSSDGKTMTTGGTDGAIHMWKIANLSETSKPWKTLIGHSKWVYQLALSSDAEKLASAESVDEIRLWNVKTGEQYLTLTNNTKTLFAFVFSPDGKTLASGSEKEIYLWDTITGEQIGVCIPDRLATSMTLIFSPDSRILMSACGGTILNFAHGEIITPHHSIINQSRSVKGGGTFQLWNARTGELLSTHAGHTNRVKAFAFSKDSKTFATGSWDGTVLLWDWEKITSIR